MPWARIFFVYGRAAEAGNGPAADGPRAARVGSRIERHRRSDTQRCAKKGRKMFFRGKDWRDVCFVLQVEVRDRVAAIAALGYRHRRENSACAGCGTGWNPACGGHRPPFQLIQLIYLRYLCVSTEREKWMDVYFLLTLYI